MKRILSFLTVFTFFLATGQVYSQRMTLQECISEGIANSKTLMIGNSEIEKSKSRLKEVSASKLPKGLLSASYTRLSEIPNSEIKVPMFPNPITIQEPLFNSYQLKLNVTQPIFLGGKISNAEEAAEFNISANQANLDVKKNEEAMKIVNAWFSLAAVNEQIKIIDENLALLNKRLADAKQLFDHGLVTKNDLLKIEVQISTVTSKKIDLATAQKTAKGALNMLMGRSVTAPLEIAEPVLDQPGSIPSFDEAVNTALISRNEFAELDLKKEALKKNLDATKSAYYPEVFLSTNIYYSNPNQRIFPMKDEFKATWDLSLIMQWSIWDWGSTSAKVDQTIETINGLSATKSLLVDAVSNEVYRCINNLENAKEQLENLSVTLNQANENYRFTSENFKGGVATATDLMDADTILFNAKTNVQLAKIKLSLSNFELLRAIGKKLY